MAKKQFQAESKKLLDMMINSIYTHKEIFLRELISNGSDAIDKLYYRSLEDQNTGISRDDFSIQVEPDKENRILRIIDNGMGMSRDEMEENLGTIAHSGSLEFKKNSGSEKDTDADIDIIGQFGVGFYSAFMVSDKVVVISRQFGSGNPRYVAGMNGCELARKVLEETNTPFQDTADVMFVDKDPEYWAGWALAFYQWYSGYDFMNILAAVPLTKIIAMYPTYHEMDIMQFVDRMDEHMRSAYPLTRLRIRRENCGLSQSELAAESGVSLRQIQLFEQRQRDINKTAAETLLQLSKALYCNMEDLMERN